MATDRIPLLNMACHDRLSHNSVLCLKECNGDFVQHDGGLLQRFSVAHLLSKVVMTYSYSYLLGECHV